MQGLNQIIDCDVLVVGGGGAALRSGLAAYEGGASVRLAVKSALAGPGTGADGATATGASEIMGIAAALGEADPRDNPDWHWRDTIAGARGLVDPDLVRILAQEAPARVRELAEQGVPFDREGGRLAQTRSDFATYPRVCRVNGHTGPAILHHLAAQVRRAGIPVDEEVMVTRLLLAEGQVAGALGIRVQTGEPVLYRCRAVVLAAGGMGAAFRHSVSGPLMTGDAYAMAYEAGAELVNMDVTQVSPGMIHPAWAWLSRPFYLLPTRLRNGEGELFLTRYLPEGVSEAEVFAHKAAPYTTSDASRYVDEAIEAECRAGRTGPHGGIFYDLTHVPPEQVEQQLGNTVRHLARFGVDLSKAPIEVAILFHMVNGGVRMVNGDAASTVPGLYAAGEAAGGVRGPNRPGGNSLAEGQVFGRRAGMGAAAWARSGAPVLPAASLRAEWFSLTGGEPASRAQLTEQRSRIQGLMTGSCLVAKEGSKLEAALDSLAALADEVNRTTAAEPGDLALALGNRNLVTAARVLVKAALARTETRGAHYRVDYPAQDDANWSRSLLVERGPDGPQVRLLAYSHAL